VPKPIVDVEPAVKVELRMGSSIRISLKDADGYFDVSYAADGQPVLTVFAELPDVAGREGIIYREAWNPEKLALGKPLKHPRRKV
jgi:hypothetical protein